MDISKMRRQIDANAVKITDLRRQSENFRLRSSQYEETDEAKSDRYEEESLHYDRQADELEKENEQLQQDMDKASAELEQLRGERLTHQASGDDAKLAEVNQKISEIEGNILL